MDELTREQEEAVAATVGAIQRIAMAIVALPKEERAAQYDLVRRQFEASITEFGIEGGRNRGWRRGCGGHGLARSPPCSMMKTATERISPPLENAHLAHGC
jgi:hypothetical protein